MEKFLISFAALIFVLCLVGIVAIIFKKVTQGKYNLSNPSKRLNIIETLTLNAKQKLYLIKYDESEHLILTSENNSIEIIKKDKNEKPM